MGLLGDAVASASLIFCSAYFLKLAFSMARVVAVGKRAKSVIAATAGGFLDAGGLLVSRRSLVARILESLTKLCSAVRCWACGKPMYKRARKRPAATWTGRFDSARSAPSRANCALTLSEKTNNLKTSSLSDKQIKLK